MEVDEKENIDVKSNKSNQLIFYDFEDYKSEIFKYDYENQKIENKSEFKNWKSKLKRKYGKIIGFINVRKIKHFLL